MNNVDGISFECNLNNASLRLNLSNVVFSGFRYFQQYMEWDDASANCKNMEGDLATLQTYQQWEAASQYIFLHQIHLR